MDYYQKYKQQFNQAKQRNIDWEFTYESWLDTWGDKISLRGRKNNEYCMARIGDKGSYSPDNVEIITNLQNKQDATYNGRNKTPHRSVEIFIDNKWHQFRSISESARYFGVNPGTILNSYRQTGTYRGHTIRMLEKSIKTTFST